MSKLVFRLGLSDVYGHRADVELQSNILKKINKDKLVLAIRQKGMANGSVGPLWRVVQDKLNGERT